MRRVTALALVLAWAAGGLGALPGPGLARLAGGDDGFPPAGFSDGADDGPALPAMEAAVPAPRPGPAPGLLRRAVERSRPARPAAPPRVGRPSRAPPAS